MIHVTDWLSTIVHLAGGSQPNNTDSINQWEALTKNNSSSRKEFVYDLLFGKNNNIRAAIR